MYQSTIQFIQRFFRQISGKLFFLLISLLVIGQAKGQGNLQISPSRVVFEGSKRILEMNLANLSSDSEKYVISFRQLKMTEDGQFEEITSPEPGQNFADKNIRFFPRAVMMGPNENQVVKVQLLRAEQLQPGEYRSHLYFKSLTPLKALGEEDGKKGSNGVSLSLKPTFGITVPVIIRVGESTTTVDIKDIKLLTAADGSKKINLSITRTGNMSVYGDLVVSLIAPNGKETKIGNATAIAVYTPNTLRKVTFDLENRSKVDLSRGIVKVVYSTQSDTKPVKLAEARQAI